MCIMLLFSHKNHATKSCLLHSSNVPLLIPHKYHFLKLIPQPYIYNHDNILLSSSHEHQINLKIIILSWTYGLASWSSLIYTISHPLSYLAFSFFKSSKSILDSSYSWSIISTIKFTNHQYRVLACNARIPIYDHAKWGFLPLHLHIRSRVWV